MRVRSQLSVIEVGFLVTFPVSAQRDMNSKLTQLAYYVRLLRPNLEVIESKCILLLDS